MIREKSLPMKGKIIHLIREERSLLMIREKNHLILREKNQLRLEETLQNDCDLILIKNIIDLTIS